MYRFIIADDEALIRKGILRLLDYQALGFSLCGETSTGEQTYRCLMEQKPDLALVDIRMPEMSGLEAIKKARNEGYRGKVVIISSFSDFCYAQEAIRNSVDNYIIKPIDERELKQIFLDIKAELDQQPADPERTGLKAILSGTVPASGADVFQIGVFVPFDDTAALQELRIPGLTQEEFACCTMDNSHVVLLKGAAAIQKFQDVCSDAASRLLEPYFMVTGPEISAQQIPDAYRSAKELLQRRFFCSPQQHLLRHHDPAANYQPAPSISSKLTEAYTLKLLSYIQTFNRRLIKTTLAELRSVLCSGNDDPDKTRLFLMDLYLQIKNTMNSRYPTGTFSFYANSSIIRQIFQSRYLDEILDFIANRLDMIVTCTGAFNRETILDDVLHYIHHNYADNMTLEEIAPLFGYNPSYLGKIFRKKLGCSFISYVDQVRIEKAKELLAQDDAKVYAIAEKVGYKNVDYFHVKFRKYVDQSPAEYRKANRTKDK